MSIPALRQAFPERSRRAQGERYSRAGLIILFLLLAACGGAEKHRAARTAAETIEPAAGPAARGVGPWAQKIMDAAYGEWVFFGQQRVVLTQDEESIPHVGVWEDDDWVHSDRINQYWRAAGEPGLTGNDCSQPWSAAFISWIMATAGVPQILFPPAISHWVYLSRFVAEAQTPNAVFIPHAVGDYRPKPGDLICASREKDATRFSLDQLPELSALERAKLHCDIVIQSDGRNLQVIGGNVRNSVSKSTLPLSPQGYLQPIPRRSWFMVIENRLD